MPRLNKYETKFCKRFQRSDKGKIWKLYFLSWMLSVRKETLVIVSNIFTQLWALKKISVFSKYIFEVLHFWDTSSVVWIFILWISYWSLLRFVYEICGSPICYKLKFSIALEKLRWFWSSCWKEKKQMRLQELYPAVQTKLSFLMVFRMYNFLSSFGAKLFHW